MALYKVTDNHAAEDAPCRLVKANSAASALRHIAGTRFNVEVVTSAERAADILTSGVDLEVAGEELAPAPATEVVVEEPVVEETPVEEPTVEEEVEGLKRKAKAVATEAAE